MLSYKHLMCGHLPSIPGVGERVTVPFFFFFLSFVVGCRQIPDLSKTKKPMFNTPFSWGYHNTFISLTSQMYTILFC